MIPLSLLAAILSGCNMHGDLLPFLGKWKGKYEVKSIVGGGSDKDRVREQLQGFVGVTGENNLVEIFRATGNIGDFHAVAFAANGSRAGF